MGNCECGGTKICGESSNLNLNDVITKISNSEPQKDQESAQSNQEELTLKIRTWQKESYSLFDYENQGHLKEQSMTVATNGVLVRRTNDILWLEEQSFNRSSDDVFLFRVILEEGRFSLVNNILMSSEAKEQFSEDENRQEQTTKYHNTRRSNNQQNDQNDDDQFLEEEQRSQSQVLQQQCSFNLRQTKVFEMGCKMWCVIKSIQKLTGSPGLRLIRGDVIKMGRVKFKVREINFKSFDRKERDVRRASEASQSSQEGKSQCRVCLGTSQSVVNPLVNPCRCAGTMKYIHLECLKTWLRSKLHSHHSDYCLIYMWKNLECELCKFNYPPIFKSDDVFYDLVELSKPRDTPYMLLEISQKKYEDSVQQSRDETGQVNASNGVYIITFGQKRELRVGRAHETEVRINDISVSRMHAIFKMVKSTLQSNQIDGDVYVSDTSSKFGTLVMLQGKFPVHQLLNGIEIQVSRSVLTLYLGQGETKISYDDFEECMGRAVPQEDGQSDQEQD